jgi:hypothetical protein
MCCSAPEACCWVRVLWKGHGLDYVSKPLPCLTDEYECRLHDVDDGEANDKTEEGGDEEDDRGEGEDGSRSEEGRPERRGEIEAEVESPCEAQGKCAGVEKTEE